MTKLGYCLSIATIAFGSASLQASDNSKPTEQDRSNHMQCMTYFGNEGNIASYKNCIEKYNISPDKAAQLRGETYNQLKKSAVDTIKEHLPKEKK